MTTSLQGFSWGRQMVDLRYPKIGGSLVPKDSIATKYFHFSFSLKKNPHHSSSPGARVHIPPNIYQEQGSDPGNFSRRCSLSWEMDLLNPPKSVSSYTGHDWRMALCSTSTSLSFWNAGLGYDPWTSTCTT